MAMLYWRLLFLLGVCIEVVLASVVFRADTASGLSLCVFDDDSFSLGHSKNNHTSWLASGPIGFCAGGTWYLTHTSANSTALRRIGSAATVGSDAKLGGWRGWELRYAGGEVPFVCTFKFFPQREIIVFEHRFPGIVPSFNTTSTGCTTTPASAFPTWVAGHADEASKLGHMTWGTSHENVDKGHTASVTQALSRGCGGAERELLVLFKQKSGEALALSPLSRDTIMGPLANNAPSCAVGKKSSFALAGSSASSLVVAWSSHGVSDVVHTLGRTLLLANGAREDSVPLMAKGVTDRSAATLAFWTGNGANVGEWEQAVETLDEPGLDDHQPHRIGAEDCTAIRRSLKYSARCTPEASPKWPLLITGVGRSGTQYMAKILKKLGFDVVHDNAVPGSDGAVNWAYAFNSEDAPLPHFAQHVPDTTRFAKVFLQVRNPIQAIASRMTASIKQDVIDANTAVKGYSTIDKAARSLEHWLSWNMHIMRFADVTYRIEDVDIVWLCQQAGFGERCPTADQVEIAKASLSRTTHHRSHQPLTWSQLSALAPLASELAMDLGSILGYDTPSLPPPNAGMSPTGTHTHAHTDAHD